MVTFVAIILTQFLTIAAGMSTLLLLLFYVVFIGIFTIVPKTQYVYINDTVTFECATNETGYSIYIFFGGVPPSLLISETLPNGVRMISFNLTATNASNGTDVTCKAFSNDGNATETAYLYVQG